MSNRPRILTGPGHVRALLSELRVNLPHIPVAQSWEREDALVIRDEQTAADFLARAVPASPLIH